MDAGAAMEEAQVGTLAEAVVQAVPATGRPAGRRLTCFYTAGRYFSVGKQWRRQVLWVFTTGCRQGELAGASPGSGW